MSFLFSIKGQFRHFTEIIFGSQTTNTWVRKCYCLLNTRWYNNSYFLLMTCMLFELMNDIKDQVFGSFVSLGSVQWPNVETVGSNVYNGFE